MSLEQFHLSDNTPFANSIFRRDFFKKLPSTRSTIK